MVIVISLKVWQWHFFPLLLQMLLLGGSMSHLCSSASSFSIAYSSPFCVKPQLNTTLVVYSLPQSIRQTRTHAQSCCVGNILRLGWCTFFSQFKYMYIPNLELVYTQYQQQSSLMALIFLSFDVSTLMICFCCLLLYVLYQYQNLISGGLISN